MNTENHSAKTPPMKLQTIYANPTSAGMLRTVSDHFDGCQRAIDDMIEMRRLSIPDVQTPVPTVPGEFVMNMFYTVNKRQVNLALKFYFDGERAVIVDRESQVLVHARHLSLVEAAVWN